MSTDTDTREPLLWVCSTSGWVEEAIVARLLPPAEILESDVPGTPPPHPYLVTVTRETTPACELLMRQHGVTYGADGAMHQNVPAGWTIAATIFIATRPGKQHKQFRNYADALTDDPQRLVFRLPYIEQWHLSSIDALPRWDLTPTQQEGRRRARRSDGLPERVADDFTALMRHVRALVQGQQQPVSTDI